MENMEVAEYIYVDGLGYTVQHGISGSDIKDKELADLWASATLALKAIEDYLHEELEAMEG